MFVLSPLLPEDAAAEQVEHMRKVIEGRGGSIFETDAPKLRALAYPVVRTWEGKKSTYDQGLFGWLKIEVDSTELPVIQTELRSMQHLLRLAITYAYLDVRPVRRIPTEERSVETVASDLPPERVPMPEADPIKTTIEPKPIITNEEPKKVLSEAEIDKQIEDLLS